LLRFICFNPVKAKEGKMKRKLLMFTVLSVMISSFCYAEDLSEKQSELFKAAILGDINEVERLITAGADVNGQNSFGHTPLMAAAFANRKEIVEFLIACGADVTIRDNRGANALVYALLKCNKQVAVDLETAMNNAQVEKNKFSYWKNI